MLNKRKKVKVSSKIESLVSTAKQGAFKGLKSRKKKS
jgi:Txe/YoeB family toxin of Txe-Axe toxin-antitoxin module